MIATTPPTMRLGRMLILGALGAGLALATPAAAAPASPLQEGETWAELRGDLVEERELLDGAALLDVTTPYRAEDAALVPVEIRQLPGGGETITRLLLVVDENPAPLAAEFEFGPGMGELSLSTRVRVDQYSNLRVIAETASGDLYMTGGFVKASGGCSAPSLKNMDAAIANLGRMKMRFYEEASRPADAAQTPMRREAQVMLRHPNYSGLQMNQLTQLFIPARFVDELEVRQGEELVFRMTGGISISEDPSIRFGFRPNGADALSVRARDTDGASFEQSFPIEAEGL